MMEEHRKAIIGSESSFWLYSTFDGYDLTHPPRPDSARVYPRIALDTTSAKVTIDPAKSALVVIDMQNFFLSPCLGRPEDGKGLQACDQLLKFAIPACRKAGIRIIWLNWGLTEHDIGKMPPSTIKAFGFSTVPADDNASRRSEQISTHSSKPPMSSQLISKDPRIYKGLGSELGPITLEDGTKVDGGRMLMRDQWNTELYPSLENARQEGVSGKYRREDVWIHKDRLSGLWGGDTLCTKYLEANGIRTLLFAGVNTDQCVAASLQDAYTKSYDCLLLSDGSATTSPATFQECIEANTAKISGFVLDCKALAKGVDNMIVSQQTG